MQKLNSRDVTYVSRKAKSKVKRIRDDAVPLKFAAIARPPRFAGRSELQDLRQEGHSGPQLPQILAQDGRVPLQHFGQICSLRMALREHAHMSET